MKQMWKGLTPTKLLNKHDNDPCWDKQITEERIKYLESELAARHRLDGWVIKGLQKELDMLNTDKKEYEPMNNGSKYYK